MSEVSRKCCLVFDKLLRKNKNKLRVLHFRPCGKKVSLHRPAERSPGPESDGRHQFMEAQRPSGVSPFDRGPGVTFPPPGERPLPHMTVQINQDARRTLTLHATKACSFLFSLCFSSLGLYGLTGQLNYMRYSSCLLFARVRACMCACARLFTPTSTSATPSTPHPPPPPP